MNVFFKNDGCMKLFLYDPVLNFPFTAIVVILTNFNFTYRYIYFFVHILLKSR